MTKLKENLIVGSCHIIVNIAKGQLFQKVENDENRFFAITSSKLVSN